MGAFGKTEHVPVPGGTLAVTTAGEGRPLIFLHKLGGNAAEWHAVAQLLANERQVVLVELPGHGESKITGEAPLFFTHAQLAGIVEYVLGWLDIRSAVDFVGSSIGGSVALAFAAMLPWRVEHVISTGSSWTLGSTREQLAEDAQAKVGAEFDQDGTPLPRSLEDVKLFGFEQQAEVDALNRSRAQAGQWIGPHARAVAFDRFAPYLDRIEAKVTLAYGEKGHYGDYAREGVTQIAGAKAVEISGANAFPHEDKPAAMLEVIRAALAK